LRCCCDEILGRWRRPRTNGGPTSFRPPTAYTCPELMAVGRASSPDLVNTSFLFSCFSDCGESVFKAPRRCIASVPASQGRTGSADSFLRSIPHREPIGTHSRGRGRPYGQFRKVLRHPGSLYEVLEPFASGSITCPWLPTLIFHIIPYIPLLQCKGKFTGNKPAGTATSPPFSRSS
jgi:hypothetical protein